MTGFRVGLLSCLWVLNIIALTLWVITNKNDCPSLIFPNDTICYRREWDGVYETPTRHYYQGPTIYCSWKPEIFGAFGYLCIAWFALNTVLIQCYQYIRKVPLYVSGMISCCIGLGTVVLGGILLNKYGCEGVSDGYWYHLNAQGTGLHRAALTLTAIQAILLGTLSVILARMNRSEFALTENKVQETTETYPSGTGVSSINVSSATEPTYEKF